MAITKATASSVAPAAKGDLVVGSGTNDAAILSVGTNGHTLVADSSTSTGLAYRGLVGVSAQRTNVSTSVTANTNYVVPLTTEFWDTNSFHDNSTNNSRITIPTGFGGKYLIGLYCGADDCTAAIIRLTLFKNGSAFSGTGGGYSQGVLTVDFTNSNSLFPQSTAQVVEVSAGDYLELVWFQNSTQTLTNFYASFQAIYLGA